MGTQLSPKGAQYPPFFSPCLLWPNGCMDQDATWYGGRPRPRPHCVRWGPSPPKRGHNSPHFSAHVRCDRTAVWIKMPLGTDVDLSPGYIVLDGDPAADHKNGHSSPPLLGPCLLWLKGWIDQDATWHGGRARPRPHCVRWAPISPPKGAQQPPLFGRCLLWPNGWMDQDDTWY